MSGNRTYYLPDDVEVSVDYTIEEGAPCFDTACIGDATLDAERLQIEVNKNESTLRSRLLPTEVVTLAVLFQRCLDADADDIMQDEHDGALEARADERAGR